MSVVGKVLSFGVMTLDYDVEKCECNDFALGTLFTSGEAN
jgi:hypothetical protein